MKLGRRRKGHKGWAGCLAQCRPLLWNFNLREGSFPAQCWCAPAPCRRLPNRYRCAGGGWSGAQWAHHRLTRAQAPARVLHRDPPPVCRLRGDIGFPVFNDLSGNRGFNPVYAFLIFFCFLCLFKIEEPVSHCVSGQSAVWCADHSHVPVFPAAGVDQPHYPHSVRRQHKIVEFVLHWTGFLHRPAQPRVLLLHPGFTTTIYHWYMFCHISIREITPCIGAAAHQTLRNVQWP